MRATHGNRNHVQLKSTTITTYYHYKTLLSAHVNPPPTGPMSTLRSLLTGSGRQTQPFVLLQSSTSASCLSILSSIVAHSKGHVLLICLLYTPQIFLAGASESKSAQILDCTAHIPHYHDQAECYREQILGSLNSLGTVVCDTFPGSLRIHRRVKQMFSCR